MKKVLTLILIAVFASIAAADPLTVTQNFSVDGNPFMRIDEAATANDEELNPNRSQEDFDLTPTGFSWGGFASPGSFRVEIDEFSVGGVVFDELVFKSTGGDISDSYAYTILSSTGTNAPDTFVDMTGVDAAIHLKICDIWNGWFGGGDNGSGLPEPCNEERATVLRAMLRDSNGDWFVSDLFCPSTYEEGDLDGTVAEYTLFVNDVSWRKLPQNETDNLNLLQGNDEIPIARDPNVTDAPDFTYVSGMGIYVWNTKPDAGGWLGLTEISLLGETPPIPGALTQNFDKSLDSYHPVDTATDEEAVQTPSFTTTPTGWSWGGYCSEIPGAFRVEIDRNTYIADDAVSRTVDELLFKNTSGPSTTDPPTYGSYAYTIFDSDGGNQPDSFIDLTVPSAAMSIKVTDFWTGWYGGGDNGSGLPGIASEKRATVLRAMIRDEVGNWYASDVFCPAAEEAPGNTDGYYSGQEFEGSINLASTTWYEYDQGEEDVLNALASGDQIQLPRDPNLAAAQPDLTKVSGMGVYVWSQLQIQSGSYGIKEISLLGANVIQPEEEWDTDELQDLAGDWLVDMFGWNESMDVDPLSTGNWVLRDTATAEYIMDNGKMVILGNNPDWELDTTPAQLFNGTTTVTAVMRSTSPTANSSSVDRAGINLYVKGDIDTTNGTLETNINVRQEMDNTQYVEFVSDWTPGTSWPPASYVKVEGDGVTDFDSSMLTIDVSIDPNDAPLTTGEVTYTISDESGTTATGSFTMNRRDTQIGPSIHTLYSEQAGAGEVDSLVIMSGYSSPYDRAGSDGIINYLDFDWLSDRWLDVRTDPWP